MNTINEKLIFTDEIKNLLNNAKSVITAKSIEHIYELTCEAAGDNWHEVKYEIQGKGTVTEALVCKAKNGIAANYVEPYMRRRDPDCMLIGDNLESDKKKYKDVYKSDFNDLRTETLDWLKGQDLMIFPFFTGPEEYGIPSIAIAPANANFFAFGLALLQGVVDIDKYDKEFSPQCYLFVAPPFRHTHFNGKQIVVHNRLETRYEIFSYNLYPGPSAKKGLYGTLLYFGESEGWVTNHASAVQVITPYGTKKTIMHEGASGGGKSEMNEHLHRNPDGSLFLGRNIITEDERHITLPRGCELRPVADDMAIAHTKLQKNNGKLTILDAEHSWFIRVDHIKNYGTDPDIEARAIHPEKPLLFLNIDTQPNTTALLWEHIEDAPGKPCPNPRFILPRDIVPSIVSKPLSVDIRSFGVRTPPCTKENPNYGILGLFHILPPALAWLWRLVSPRGHDNPSIVDSGGMQSEGVGSYWPFATGKKIVQANLLLEQFIASNKVLNVLCPIKHIGAWNVGFMPQWIMREYITRRGDAFLKSDLKDSRCPLLGYSLKKLVIEGQELNKIFLLPEMQSEVGLDAYDKGAQILTDFFKKELSNFNSSELHSVGKKIIDCFMSNGSVSDYEEILPCENLFEQE